MRPVISRAHQNKLGWPDQYGCQPLGEGMRHTENKSAPAYKYISGYG